MRFGFDPYIVVTTISAAIYMMLLTGILLLMRKRIARLFNTVRYSKRLKNPRTSGTAQIGMMKNLDGMIGTVMQKPITGKSFIAFMIGLFFMVSIVSMGNLPIGMSLLVGLCFSLLPYLLLRVKLERLRRKGSYEGEKLVTALLTHYWMCRGNIAETIEKTISSGEGLAVTINLLSALLIELRSTGSNERIKRAADRFAFGINTNWSRMLAYDIRTAALSGTDISTSLEDILVQLREARALAEERKRINGESVRMVIFLIPLLYIGTMAVAVFQMNLGFLKLLQNQFLTPEGFGFFSVSLFLFLLNIMLLEMATNRKLDY